MNGLSYRYFTSQMNDFTSFVIQFPYEGDGKSTSLKPTRGSVPFPCREKLGVRGSPFCFCYRVRKGKD